MQASEKDREFMRPHREGQGHESGSEQEGQRLSPVAAELEKELERLDKFDPEAHEGKIESISDVLVPLNEDLKDVTSEELRNSRFFNEYRDYEHLERRRQEDLKYYRKVESERYANIDLAAKLYQDSEYSKAQQELMQLLQDKMDPNAPQGKEKAKFFVAKLQEHLKNQVGSLKIDDVTVAKIEELFLTRKMVTNQELAARQYSDELRIEERVAPSIDEYQDPEYIPRDSFKERPISFEDYNLYILSLYVEQNNLELYPSVEEAETVESVFSDEEIESYGVGKHRDKTYYEQAIISRREQLTEYLGLESVQHSLDAFSLEDLYRSRGYEGLDTDLKSFELILGSLQQESSSLEARLEEQYKVIMKHKGINHDANP